MRIFSLFNITVVTVCIIAGYCIANAPKITSSSDNLESSALRVAEAFEIYNEKRFAN